MSSAPIDEVLGLLLRSHSDRIFIEVPADETHSLRIHDAQRVALVNYAASPVVYTVVNRKTCEPEHWGESDTPMKAVEAVLMFLCGSRLADENGGEAA
jgi:hypothetical protein